jgi:hypothetical protein
VRRPRWRHVSPLLFLAALGLLGWHGWSRLDHRPLRVMQTPLGEAREVLPVGSEAHLPDTPMWASNRGGLSLSIAPHDGPVGWLLWSVRNAETVWLLWDPQATPGGDGCGWTAGATSEGGGETYTAHGDQGVWSIALLYDGQGLRLMVGVPDRWLKPVGRVQQIHLRGDTTPLRMFTVSPDVRGVTYLHDGGLWLLRLRKPLPGGHIHSRPRRIAVLPCRQRSAPTLAICSRPLAHKKVRKQRAERVAR